MFMNGLDMCLCQRPLLIMAGVGSSSGQHLRPLGLNLNLGFFFSGGNVVCAEEPHAKNGAPSKESGACPQSFATEGLPSHSASLCELWHGKQAVAPFLLVLLQKIWRRRTVSGTVPWQASHPAICRFICHGVVLVVRCACRSVWKSGECRRGCGGKTELGCLEMGSLGPEQPFMLLGKW